MLCVVLLNNKIGVSVSSQQIIRYTIVLALSVLVTACGGRDDDATDPIVGAPTLGHANSTSNTTSPDYLVLSAGAYHFDNFDERNAFTPGIGWEYSPSSKIGWHAGTLSDSFGYQAVYAGVNYATKPVFYGKVRFLIGATALHKQYKEDAEPETKLVPLPAMEVKLSKSSVLNLSGSPQIDYGEHRSNAVLFFQFKLNVF